MASIIRIKRSNVAGNPTTLAAGELAYSALADNGSNGGDRLYIGMGTETSGNAANHVVIGGKYFTDMVTAATDANTASTLVKRDASGNFSAGTITANLSGSATRLATGRTISLTGDVTYTSGSFDGSGNVTGTATLANSGVTAGSYGSSTAVPVITVDAKGRVTSVSTSSISTTLTISDTTFTDSVALGADTLTFAGGTGVTTAVSNNRVTFNIGQAVGTSSDVSFNNLTLSGYLRGPSTFTIDPAAHGDDTGTVVIAGNLTVQGTTTTINSNTIEVADLSIVVAKNAANASQANGAGLAVTGADASLFYSSADDRWNLNKDLNVGRVYGNLTGNVTGNASTATALETGRTISLTGDVTYTSETFDGTSNVTGTATLASVGPGAGSYQIAEITLDAKGRVTGATTVGNVTASSVYLGGNAGGTNQATIYSVAVGYNALQNNTSSGTIGIGADAGRDVVYVDNNGDSGNGIFIGPGAGYNNGSRTVGSTNNIAIGYSAYASNSTGVAATGYENIAVGAFTLSNVTTGHHNVTVGGRHFTEYEGVGTAITTGSYNTLVGAGSGYSLTTGSNNTVIGYGAATSTATVSNEVTIGNSSVTSFRIPGLGITWTNSVKPITGNQTITLSGDVSGSGTTAITVSITTVDGGTY